MERSNSGNLHGSLKSIANRCLRVFGYEVRRTWSSLPPVAKHKQPKGAPSLSHVDGIQVIQAPQYLIPNAHKLYDFRTEPGFGAVAAQVIAEGRTLLDYDRLYTLWQATRNTHALNHPVAEVGIYRGGSTCFLARAYAYWRCAPAIYAFDTFAGHPDIITHEIDGPHTLGLFGDTSLESVQHYLSPFENVHLHQGVFPESAGVVENQTFSCVHIDVDLHQSARACLEFFWPRLCAKGAIVVDDYGFVTCHGLKAAVDQFVAQHSDCMGWYVYTGQYLLEKRGDDAPA